MVAEGRCCEVVGARKQISDVRFGRQKMDGGRCLAAEDGRRKMFGGRRWTEEDVCYQEISLVVIKKILSVLTEHDISDSCFGRQKDGQRDVCYQEVSDSHQKNIISSWNM
jgi:hypothetical protein